MLVEISNGELLDKISILMIKREKIADPEKLANVETELAILLENGRKLKEAFQHTIDLEFFIRKLVHINEKLWDVEDAIRKKEAAKEFDDEFTELARAVYFTNDERSAIKRAINKHTGSNLVEEKSYAKY